MPTGRLMSYLFLQVDFVKSHDDANVADEGCLITLFFMLFI